MDLWIASVSAINIFVALILAKHCFVPFSRNSAQCNVCNVHEKYAFDMSMVYYVTRTVKKNSAHPTLVRYTCRTIVAYKIKGDAA